MLNWERGELLPRGLRGLVAPGEEARIGSQVRGLRQLLECLEGLEAPNFQSSLN